MSVLTTPPPSKHATGKTAAVPTLREIIEGWRHTRLLLKLRWRFVRDVRSRAFIWFGAAIFLSALFAASQIGTLVRRYAEDGVATAAGQFAVNYVVALNRGELGAVGAGAIGSVIIVALFTPFTGAGMQSLASADDLTGIRPTRIHRYFDSVTTNAASAIGFLQLLTLTGLGSLLTLDGGRPAGLLFMWTMWPALVMLTAAEGWLVELAHRRFGIHARRGIATALALGIAVAVYLDPDHGRTIFGLSDKIVATLSSAAAGDHHIVARNAAIMGATCLLLFAIGVIACRAALAHPAPVARTRDQRRRLLPMSSRPGPALMQILIAQVLRTPEVRRPLITIVLIGLPAVWFGGQENVMLTMVVAIPLAVALAFGINIFGILGPAMPWLASQPTLMPRILRYSVALQLTLTALIATMVWAPVTIAGRIDLGDVAAVAAGTAVATALTARSAAYKAVNRPFLVRLGTRGDMIVPPLTAINYTLRFALWSGQLGVLVMSRDGLLQAALVAFALLWATLRFLHLARQWAERDTQAFVVKQVAAA